MIKDKLRRDAMTLSRPTTHIVMKMCKQHLRVADERRGEQAARLLSVTRQLFSQTNEAPLCANDAPGVCIHAKQQPFTVHVVAQVFDAQWEEV